MQNNTQTNASSLDIQACYVAKKLSPNQAKWNKVNSNKMQRKEAVATWALLFAVIIFPEESPARGTAGLGRGRAGGRKRDD